MNEGLPDPAQPGNARPPAPGTPRRKPKPRIRPAGIHEPLGLAGSILYALARTLVFLIQRLPIRWAARLGRTLGGLVHALDARHRRVAIQNLGLALGGERTPEQLRAIARENFLRIGENIVCSIRTAAMDGQEILEVLQVTGLDAMTEVAWAEPSGPRTWVAAIGHFGNFELYARTAGMYPGFKGATTYRGLKQPALNRLMHELRSKSGCLFFDRRDGAEPLRAFLSSTNAVLGLLADQHAGDHGLWLPFFGTDCSTSAAPAVLALRYRARLVTMYCRRVELGRWQVVFGREIPVVDAAGANRSPEEIMAEVNREFEMEIRRDPANWFWVHKRWKPRKVKPGPAPSRDPLPLPEES